MFKDKYGLPIQSDGDNRDQLQRVGMIATAEALRECDTLTEVPTYWALFIGLQESPGVYKRSVEGATNDVSADQLIATLSVHVAYGHTRQVWLMLKECLRRFGFAQNYKDGLNGDTRTKIPDFMFVRALPLFARLHWSLYPFTLLADFLLVLLALSACGPVWKDGAILPSKREATDVDDNNTVITLAVCRKRMPTPLSILACKLYGKLRPWNMGCYAEDDPVETEGLRVFNPNYYHPVYGALRWYHRARSGGNPEIAALWRPLCKELFE